VQAGIDKPQTSLNAPGRTRMRLTLRLFGTQTEAAMPRY
jgi:hypothetical protein